MAYKTEIQIGVRGSAGVEKLRKEVDQLNEKLTKIQNTTKVGVLSINRYDAALAKAADSLRKVQIATKEENIAIKQYVTALRSSNAVQERQNRLIAQEITLRDRVARMKALPKATPTTQFDSPIGPGPASPISSRPKPRPTGLQKFADFGLGAGFPLLFGGGAGQVLGGGLGTILGGGGPAGFGLQIAFSAIGQQLEDALRRIQEIDNAIQALDMDALAGTAITVNAELRQSVQNLVDMGEAQKAVEVAANAVLQQTGVLPESVSDSANAVTLLSNVWDQVVAAVSGLLSLIGTPIVSALTLVLKLVGQGVKGINFFISLIGVGIKRLVQLIRFIPGGRQLLEGIENATAGINESAESRLATARQTGTELAKELSREKEIFAIEQKRVSGNTAAAKLNNAQAKRDEALAKLRFETEDKIVDKRRELAGLRGKSGQIEREFQVVLIEQTAEIEKQRILRQFALDEEAANQLKIKEIEKERKKLAKQAQEIRARESQIAQARIQTQLNELSNEEKIFQLRQQTADAELNLQNVRYKAESSLLQLQESRMQRRLANLQRENINFDAQRKLIDAIAKNRVQQAKVERNVAITQAKQGIRQAEIALQQIRFQVQRINLEIQLQKVKARGEKDEEVRKQMLEEINQIEKQNAKFVDVMVEEGVKRVKIAKEIAKEQIKIANNIFKGKVEAIEAERVEARRAVTAKELAAATGQAADEAGRFSSNMSRGIGSGPRKGETSSTKLKIDPDVYDRVVGEANQKVGGGFRDIFQLTEALDAAQMLKNTQARQRAEAAKREEERQAAFSYMNSLNTPSSSSYRTAQVATVPVRNATTKAPVVNVNTGPVMEFDGSKYVSVADFEKGLASVARSQATTSRSYGGRNYAGVS